jgi:hypothetical protein
MSSSPGSSPATAVEARGIGVTRSRCAPIDRGPHGLLRRHVRDLPLEDANLGRLRGERRLGDAEVDELDLPVVRHEHVVRRDVAMDDLERSPVVVAELVGVIQPTKGVGDDSRTDHRIERPLGLQQVANNLVQRLPLQVLHRDEILSVLLADLERVNDVRVIEARGEACLIEEHCDECGILGELGA